MLYRPLVKRAPGESAAVLIQEEILVTESLDEMTMPLPDLLGAGADEPFRYCLNTSTVRAHKLPLNELVDVAAGAGYEAIEPWIDEIERFVDEGGDLKELSARIRDLGLTVESAIGFFEWAVDDEARRRQGLLDARRAMGLVARLGGKRIAAPPFGMQQADAPALDLFAAADRYRELLEVGEETGVVPELEFWGFSKNLSRLSEAMLVAAQSGHRDACILADVYHMYKGGSPQAGLSLLSPDAIQVFHVNDYPAILPEVITDADRVYPGDGIAPLVSVLQDLNDIGFRGVLSLELFNPEYYKEEPLHVARTGLEKLKAVVAQALG
mgnify:CR=1 FL=1|jgi:Sugar phosphate isomerases/epimerases